MSAAHRVLLGLIVGVGFTVRAEAGDTPSAKPGKYALLVGCTRYPNLKLAYQLRGPANDVKLMRDLLVERFGFSAKDILILSEEAGDDDRPIKQRIRRAFERLAKVAGKGDRVVIHLSGHGSQQPQKNLDDPQSYEPDGLSEIFLPADIGSWDDGKKEVANAIVDGELRSWLKAIRAKGASLVLIVDSCHAGGVARGANVTGANETFREVPAEELVPDAALKEAARKAQQRGETTRGTDKKSSPFALPRFAPDLAVIYASQSTEPTVELKLPRGSEDAKPFGLLTYTLVQALRQSAEPLTYRELVQRIQARYVGMGRYFPTPLVEGKDQDREFLGQREWPGRSRIRVKKGGEAQERMVNAGAIHGLTAGSILAVYPPLGEARGKTPLGHARVTRLGALDAYIEPCAYAGLDAPKELPIGGRCEVVFTAYANRRLRVALDESANRGKTTLAEQWRRLRQELDKQDKKTHSLIQFIQEPADAEWLVRDAGGQVVLVSAAALAGGKGAPQMKSFGPAPLDDLLGEWLLDNLSTIARARNLLALATAASTERGDPDNSTNVKIELVRYRAKQPGAFDMVEWSSGGRELHKGDKISFRITNSGRYAADVTLLFVDSAYGIAAVFPERGTSGDNRLRPGKSLLTPRVTVNAQTTGLEHVVMIAVKTQTEEQPVDFSFLAQPNLQQARLKAPPGQRMRGLDSPLGLLLQNALYGEGNQRGLTRELVNDYCIRILSWTTLPLAADQQSRSTAPPQATPATASDRSSASARRDTSAKAPKKDAVGWYSWPPALYVCGGLLAGVLLVLLLYHRNAGTRRSSESGPNAP